MPRYDSLNWRPSNSTARSRDRSASLTALSFAMKFHIAGGGQAHIRGPDDLRKEWRPRYDFTRVGRGRRSSRSTSSTWIPMYGRYPGGNPRLVNPRLQLFHRQGLARTFLQANSAAIDES